VKFEESLRLYQSIEKKGSIPFTAVKS